LVEESEVKQVSYLAAEEYAGPWNMLKRPRLTKRTSEALVIDSTRNNNARPDRVSSLELFSISVRIRKPKLRDFGKPAVAMLDPSALHTTERKSKPVIEGVKGDRDPTCGQLRSEPSTSNTHAESNRSLHFQGLQSLKKATGHFFRPICPEEPRLSVEDLTQNVWMEILKHIATPIILEHVPPRTGKHYAQPGVS